MTVISKVKKTILKYQLLRPGDKVIIGVSGGADSIALLHVLSRVRAEFGLNLIVGHVNHQLRNSALRDERFVKRVCDDLHIPCFVTRLSWKPREEKGSLEELARLKRLTALMNLIKKQKGDCIAFAHHQNDLAETVLMRILRGTGLLGMGGILPKRTLYGIQVIRPFLEISKKSIIRFLDSNKINYRNDPTNRQTRFFRNKIRLDLIPYLENKYQKSIVKNLTQLAFTTGIDYEFLEIQAKKLLAHVQVNSSRTDRVRLRLAPLQRAHDSLLRLTLRLALEQVCGTMTGFTFSHLFEIEDLINQRLAGSTVHLPAGIIVRKTKEFIEIQKMS